jgi:uncharacterized protein (TIGR02145 family)
LFDSKKDHLNSFLNYAIETGYYTEEEAKERFGKDFYNEIYKKETFTDPRDDKVYRTVKIGNQVWMAENLAYAAKGSKFCENNHANGKKYGRLYNWKTAKKACPHGWHLPRDAEWQELVDFAGGEMIAGKKLKATSGWAGESGNGTDEYGFAALPGGTGDSYGGFSGVGDNCSWWRASEDSDSYAYRQTMNGSNEGVYRDAAYKYNLFSVRCLKDRAKCLNQNLRISRIILRMLVKSGKKFLFRR